MRLNWKLYCRDKENKIYIKSFVFAGGKRKKKTKSIEYIEKKLAREDRNPEEEANLKKH